MKKKGKISKKTLIITLTIILMVCAAGGYFVVKKFPIIKYFSKEIVMQLSPKELPEKAEDISSAYTTLSKLISDPRVTVNQSMMLINTEYMLSEDFIPDTGEYKDSGVIMNACLMDAYADIASSVREEFGEKLYIRSSYRSPSEQQEQIEVNGSDIATAVGASEHQAGLSLDVYVPYYAGAAFIQSPAGQWVNENCGSYGFIIRYPYYGKEDTGISYEPWHLRYVGLPHSEIIMNSHLTLESYMKLFETGCFYRYGEYLISRQEGENLKTPEDFESCVISPDNCGFYFLTFKCP